MSEMLIFSLRLTIIAMLIVFGALVFIAIVISLINRADTRWQGREQSQAEAALEKESDLDSLTLVLICSAVATILQGRYHIKKVRRLLPTAAVKGPWSMQGRAVLLGSHIVGKKR